MEGELSDKEFREEEEKWEKYFASNLGRNEIEIERHEKYRKSIIENGEIPKREGPDQDYYDSIIS